MLIEQSFPVNADQQHVWHLIRDPGQMVSCIPGCESLEASGTNAYLAIIAVSVGPVKARFSLNVDVLEESPPSYVKTQMRGDEGSRASLIQSVNEVWLSPMSDGKTQVKYSSTVEISGRLGRYGAGMMQKLATRLGTQFQVAFCELAEARPEESSYGP